LWALSGASSFRDGYLPSTPAKHPPKLRAFRDWRLTFRAENIDEHAKNIDVLQSQIAQLQETRQNLNFLQWTKKQEADKAIKQAEREALRAQIFFKNHFGVYHTQAPEEIKQIQEKVRTKESNLMTKNAAILDIMNTQDKIL